MSDAPNDYLNPFPYGTADVTLNSAPEPHEWKCEVGGGPMGLIFYPAKGQEPNAFHRFMQRLCFGFKWVRL